LKLSSNFKAHITHWIVTVLSCEYNHDTDNNPTLMSVIKILPVYRPPDSSMAESPNGLEKK